MALRRASLALLVVACGHPQLVGPSPAPPAVAHKDEGPRFPVIPGTGSWLQRTSPHEPVKDVPHVDPTVSLREGPATLDHAQPTLERIVRGCFLEEIPRSLVLFPQGHDESVTMIIETRADGTMSEAMFDPPTISKDLALCLVHELAGQPLHLERTPQHVVLAVGAHVWWSEN